MFGALNAAHEAGLRYAVLEHLYDGYYRRDCLGGLLALSLRVRRLSPRRALDGAAVRLVTALPELDPIARSTPQLCQVGPLVEFGQFDADARQREAGILISLSGFGFPGMERCLQTLVDAAVGLGARVVVTTGPAIDPAQVRAPAGMQVHR